MDRTRRALGQELQDRRTKGRLSREQVADLMRAAGVSWSRQTVDEIEHGRRRISFAEVVVLVDVLRSSGVIVTIEDFVDVVQGSRKGVPMSQGMDHIELDAEVAAWAADTPKAQIPNLAASHLAAPEAARRMAKALSDRLGRQVSAEEVEALADSLWHHGLVAERDARFPGSDEGSVPTKKGHITRQLMKELLKAMKEE